MEHSFTHRLSPAATVSLKSVIRDKMEHTGLHKLYLLSVRRKALARVHQSTWKAIKVLGESMEVGIWESKTLADATRICQIPRMAILICEQMETQANVPDTFPGC